MSLRLQKILSAGNTLIGKTTRFLPKTTHLQIHGFVCFGKKYLAGKFYLNEKDCINFSKNLVFVFTRRYFTYNILQKKELKNLDGKNLKWEKPIIESKKSSSIVEEHDPLQAIVLPGTEWTDIDGTMSWDQTFYYSKFQQKGLPYIFKMQLWRSGLLGTGLVNSVELSGNDPSISFVWSHNTGPVQNDVAYTSGTLFIRDGIYTGVYNLWFDLQYAGGHWESYISVRKAQ